MRSGRAKRHERVPVNAFAFDGGVLTVGGAFTRLAGVARRNLGQVRLADGGVTSFDPEPGGWDQARFVADILAAIEP